MRFLLHKVQSDKTDKVQLAICWHHIDNVVWTSKLVDNIDDVITECLLVLEQMCDSIYELRKSICSVR